MNRFAANITLMFQELPLLERIQVAAQKGFQGVEVQFPYSEPPERWAQALEQHQLPLALFNLPAGDFMQGGEGLACHPERQAAFKQALETSLPYIQTLQPEVVNILAGRKAEGYSHKACLEQLTENLQWACQQLAGFPIKITCEPINTWDQPGYLVPQVKAWQELAQQISADNFGLQLDLYHAVRMGDDPAQLLLENAAQLAHVQFADVPGRSHPGSGTLNWQQVWNCVKTSGYKGWLAAEYPAKVTDSFDWLADSPLYSP